MAFPWPSAICSCHEPSQQIVRCNEFFVVHEAMAGADNFVRKLKDLSPTSVSIQSLSKW